MNSKLRVIKAMNFETPDRIPIWEDTFYEEGFLYNWRKFCGFAEDATPPRVYGSDTKIFMGNESFFPSKARTIKQDEYTRIYDDGWGRIVEEKKKGYFQKTLAQTLTEKRDLDQLLFEPATDPHRLPADRRESVLKEAEQTCMFSKIGGLYIRSHFLWPEEQLLADMLLDQPFCDALFDKVAAHLLDMAIATLDYSNTWDTGLFVYDDMAATHTPMFSPALFERFFAPRYKYMIDTLKNMGLARVCLHSDGNIGPLFDLMLEAGFEGFNPLEPRSGLHLADLREKYGKRMLFFGGVCNTQILPAKDKQKIKEHVLPLIELGRQGGVVLGMASVMNDVPGENYADYQSLIEKHGRYE